MPSFCHLRRWTRMPVVNIATPTIAAITTVTKTGYSSAGTCPAAIAIMLMVPVNSIAPMTIRKSATILITQHSSDKLAARP